MNLYNFCSACNCNNQGSNGIACNNDFQCSCKTNIKGLICDACNDNFFNFPTCQSCQCNSQGSVSLKCTSDGRCNCKTGYNGKKCRECDEGFYKSQSGECLLGKSSLKILILFFSRNFLVRWHKCTSFVELNIAKVD